MATAPSAHDLTRQRFGAAAADYATNSYHAAGPDLRALLDLAAPTGNERVLDVGTGAGHTALALAPHVAKVTGIDLTPAMLAEATALAANRGLANVRFLEGNAEALPVDDGTFDLVTNRQSAHHYGEVTRAIAETFRVLRPGGRFLLIDSIAPENAQADTLLNAIEFLRDSSHVRDWRASEWIRMLTAAGFEARVVDRYGIPLDGADWTKRMRTPAGKVAMIRELFAEATPAQRAALAITDEPWGFSVPAALIEARRPA